MIFENLKPGKYKGVDFWIRTSAITGGRKTQKHEFPNSDKQTIEDFGLKPKSHRVTAFIFWPNYFQKRDALIRALDEGGAGVLTHPFYGDIPNISAVDYTINEDLSELGEAKFQISFEVDDDTGLPKQELDVIGNIETTRETLSSAAQENISNNFLVTNKFQNNFQEARQKLLELNNKVRKETSFVFKVQDGANEFNALLSDATNNVNELVTKPANLATSIVSMFDSIDSLYVNIKDSFDVYKRFNDFGESDISLDITTAGLQQRQKNNDVINSSVKAMSLGYQYQNAAKLEFDTVEEIELVESDIESNYQLLIDQPQLSGDMISTLKDLRSVTSRFFKNEKLNVDKVTDIRTPILPARIIAYQYYADSSIGKRIANLNLINDPSFVEGTIRVFTE